MAGVRRVGESPSIIPRTPGEVQRTRRVDRVIGDEYRRVVGPRQRRTVMAADPLVVLVGVTALVAFALFLVKNEARRWAAWYEWFYEQFPPISDAEFLARCRPDTNPEIALKVRRIVAESLGVEYERVYPTSRFFEDFGPD
jgi:hypothetical protein